jgi:hypothetical protein
MFIFVVKMYLFVASFNPFLAILISDIQYLLQGIKESPFVNYLKRSIFVMGPRGPPDILDMSVEIFKMTRCNTFVYRTKQ